MSATATPGRQPPTKTPHLSLPHKKPDKPSQGAQHENPAGISQAATINFVNHAGPSAEFDIAEGDSFSRSALDGTPAKVLSFAVALGDFP
jgi:hypothetical protein